MTDRVRSRGALQTRLHEEAAAARGAVFGGRVFVRAVVEVSNFCREDCRYCGMRRSDRGLARRRLDPDEVFDWIVKVCPPSATDINLQSGEDPVAARDVIAPLVRRIKAETRLGVSVCPGTLDPRDTRELLDAGADYYVIKLESPDAAHYAGLRAPGTLAERIAAIRQLAGDGWKVSSGFILGLPGAAPHAPSDAIRLLRSLPLSGASVSPFVPGPGTPLADSPAGDLEDAINCVALLRLANPNWIIPAVSAMEIGAPGSYARALQAGANLATINITPPEFRGNYPIYHPRRHIMDEHRVLDAIQKSNLTPSPTSLSEFLKKI